MLGNWILIGAVAALAAGVAAPVSADEGRSPGCIVKLTQVDAQNVPTFRGECVWSVAPFWVARVLTDPVRLAETSDALKESRLLPDGRIVNLQKTGWPFEDRQSTVEVADEPLADGGVRRRYRLASDQVPPPEGVVQVGVDEGTWEITADERGARVVLEMRYEPGGNLPTSLVQSMSPKYIARGLDDLRIGAEKLARANPPAADVASGPPTN